MANRAFIQFEGTLEKGLCWLFVTVSQTGATTIAMQAWNPNTRTYAAAASGGFRGVKSVTRTGTGQWSIVLQDTYQRAMQATITSALAGGTAVAPDVAFNTTTQVFGGVSYAHNVNTTTGPGPCVNLTLLSTTATAADPASGELLTVCLTLQNSTAL